MTARPGDPATALARFFTPAPKGITGVAVSGGSDSLALLFLLGDLLGPDRLHAVTVDHGLRAASGDEAAYVGRVAGGLGIAHSVLRWRGWDGQGNLPDQARRARYQLMAAWAAEQGIAAVALGHTQDDLAETFLMRLARGAGAGGLAAMAQGRDQGGVRFLRPLLGTRRADLRAVLEARGQAWIDDPTNEDPRYDRPRIRQALPALADLGLTVEALATSARNLRSADDALVHYTLQEARAHVRFQAGDILIARAPYLSLPSEIARRLMTASLRWIAGGDYPPRAAALDRLIEALRQGERLPLAGCLITPEGDVIRVAREPAATAEACAPGQNWDDRWYIEGPFVPGDRIGATTEAGLTQCPDRREADLPRLSLAAGPAVWREDGLISAPLAGLSEGFTARLCRTEEDFHASIRPH